MPNWKKVAEPAVRFKQTIGGNRGSLSGPGGQHVPVAYAVDCDYQRREWIIWFEGLDDDDGPGEEEIRLPWLQADPWAFHAWNHNGRLKIFFKHYEDPDRGNHRRIGVYDTGYAFV